ncbi:MAG: single-stranded DNA-binding protein [Pseudomonadota bacterium]
MISALCSGVVVRDPQSKETHNGSEYVALLVSASMGGDQSQLLNVTAFDGEVCRVLEGLRKGDAVTVAGRVSLGVYQGQSGPQVSVQLTASRVMALAEAAAKPRPRARAGRPEEARTGREFDPRQVYAAPEPELNDEIPF